MVIYDRSNYDSLVCAALQKYHILENDADAEVVGLVEDGENKLEPLHITLRYNQVKRILGCEISADRCNNILENLGFEKLGGNDAAAKFAVPSFRAYDVTREIDLIEEYETEILDYDKPGTRGEMPLVNSYSTIATVNNL